jgi:hypothetical protein
MEHSKTGVSIMRFLICCAALTFSTLAWAQAISDEMQADTKTLLELTGALNIGEQMGNTVSRQIITAMNSQNANVPDGATDVIVEVVRGHISDFINSPELIDGLVAIYAKHYTHEDILALIEFYESPLGTKMIATGQPIAQESSQFGQTLFLQRVPLIQQDIRERLQASGLIQQPPEQPAQQ